MTRDGAAKPTLTHQTTCRYLSRRASFGWIFEDRLAGFTLQNFRGASSRAALAIACGVLAACSSLLQLDELKRVDCVEACGADAGFNAGAAASGGSAGTRPSTGGAPATTGGTSSGGVGANAGANQTGGSGTAGTGAVVGNAGAGGATDTGPTGPCPGGPAPAATWKEHWAGHAEALTLRDYDDCTALYVDAAMSTTDTAWLSSFFSKAWKYNLTTYGALGSDRLYVVLHQGKFLVGHSSAFYETTHDGHNVIDAGATTWKAGDYDAVGTLLGALVASTAVPSKQGSPAAAQWGAEGFGEMYKYDLYLGLGMDAEASQAWDEYQAIAMTYPVPESYWFSDFFYPLWRDHGKTRLLSDFFALLDKNYPAVNHVMAPMDWGQFIHFMSGAARVEAKTQATYAFGWNDTWEAQFQKAKTDFPAIKY